MKVECIHHCQYYYGGGIIEEKRESGDVGGGERGGGSKGGKVIKLSFWLIFTGRYGFFHIFL